MCPSSVQEVGTMKWASLGTICPGLSAQQHVQEVRQSIPHILIEEVCCTCWWVMRKCEKQVDRLDENMFLMVSPGIRRSLKDFPDDSDTNEYILKNLLVVCSVTLSWEFMREVEKSDSWATDLLKESVHPVHKTGWKDFFHNYQ